MKLINIFTSVLLTAASIGLGGCSADDIDSPDTPDVVGEGNVTLTFRSAKNASRATDDTNNEDRINSLAVFLYPDGADSDTAEPVATATFAGLNKNAITTVKMSLTKEQTLKLFPDGDGSECRLVAIANLPATTALPASKTVMNLRNIFIAGNFVTQQGNQPQTSFVMFGDTDEGREGTVKVKYTEGDFGGTAEGNVVLVRAAARIALNVRVPETIEVDEDGSDAKVIWESQAAGMQVLLDNGVFESAVDPTVLTERPADKSYFSIGEGKNFKFVDSGETAETAYRWKQVLPFYTYPNQWESSPGETHKTTMTIIVPWRIQGTQTYRTCYYKVPVTAGTELLRNTAYTVNLNVGMLGSFIKEEPLEVAATYFAVDWEDVETGVDIKDYRYLVVNQNNYTVDNQSTISIPFYSSHEVEVESITMTYQRFNMYGNNSEVMNIPITMAQNHETGIKNNGDSIYSYQLTSDAMGNNVLTINHPLTTWLPCQSNGETVAETGYNNKTAAQNAIDNISYYAPGAGQAYSPYVITVKIKHKDMAAGSAFEQTMTIKQYPGMWILSDPNPAYEAGVDKGYVWINNSNSDGQTSAILGGVFGISSTAANKNPNMYVITINTLDSLQKQYIIDDPRYYLPINLGNNSYTTGNGQNRRTIYYLTETTNINDPIVAPVNGSTAATQLANAVNQNGAGGNGNYYNSSYTWSVSSRALYNLVDNEVVTTTTNRRLTFYYPTNEDVNFAYVIAPKLRVASSYGVTQLLSRNEARRRCASYQEAGRPAGRWRIPTLGEMEFIVNLSRTGKIPMLFTNGNSYWSAQGYVDIPSESTSDVALEAFPDNVDVSYSNWFGVTGGHVVRCVYDEWFWEEFLPASNNSFSTYYNTFTWGDRPKANPEATN